MRLRMILPSLLLSSMVLAPAAHANFFGQMGPLGPTASSGLEMVGVYLGLASHVTGAFGQARFGVGSEKVDAGVEASYAKVSGGGGSFVGAQVDLKAALAHLGSNKNAHLGGDAAVFFSHASGDNTFGISAVPGISLRSGEGAGALTGWGGFGIVWEHNSYTYTPTVRSYRPVNLGPHGFAPLRITKVTDTVSGSSSSAVMQLGGGYDVSSSMGLVGEFRHSFATGGGDDFMVGVNFGMGNKK